MFNRHQAEITVMQFRGHSLPVRHLEWHFGPGRRSKYNSSFWSYLYCLLYFDFVNKVHFLLHEISICAYVDVKKNFDTKNRLQGRKNLDTLV